MYSKTKPFSSIFTKRTVYFGSLTLHPTREVTPRNVFLSRLAPGQFTPPDRVQTDEDPASFGLGQDVGYGSVLLFVVDLSQRHADFAAVLRYAMLILQRIQDTA